MDNIKDIYNLIRQLSWHFGNHGFNDNCCEDLSLVEYMALKKIHESKNITVQETGKALNFTKSGASKIIDRLENKGYVTRETSPVDGRVCCVNTTAKGDKINSEIINKYSAYVYEMLKDVDLATIESIRSVLELLVNAAQKERDRMNE